MKIDYHSHILPKFDDGAKNIHESLKMLEIHKNQGIETVVATPHFYLHRESSVYEFLKRRNDALESLNLTKTYPQVVLAAEIAVEIDISECNGVEKLVIEGTNLILLEPSYYGHSPKAIEEIRNITYDYNLKPVIAHLHRYINFYKIHEIMEFLNLDAIFQINAEAFQNRKERKFVMQIINDGHPVVFGSDCHGVSHRSPNFEPIFKQFNKSYDIILNSDKVLRQYAV